MKFESVNRKLGFLTTVMCAALAAILVFQHTPQQNYRAQLSLGSRFLQEENYEKAEAAFRDAIKIDNKKPEPYIGLGSSYVGQANAILKEYQNGNSDEESQPKMIPKDEKEVLRTLYQKAEEALHDASERGSGDNTEIGDTISYVEQQKQKIEKIRESTDSVPAVTETPGPEVTSGPEEKKSLNDLVDTKGGSTTVLKQNSSVNTIDFDQDGKPDVISLTTSHSSSTDGDSISSAYISVNDKKALDLTDSMSTETFTPEDIADIQATILQMNDGEIFLAPDFEIVDLGSLTKKLYRYQNGKFSETIDLEPVCANTGDYETTGSNFDFKAIGNTIQFHVGIDTLSMAGIESIRTLICHDETVEFLSNEAAVVPKSDEDDVLKDSLDLYKGGDPSVYKDAIVTLDPGTKCRITKAYFTEGMRLQRLFLATEDGRSGWFNQNEFGEAEYDTIFEKREHVGGGWG